MKIKIYTLFIFSLSVLFAYSQNQTFDEAINVYTFNNHGSFQLTDIPEGTTFQIECYGAGGGAGGLWGYMWASTSSCGGGGGGYARTNTFIATGSTLNIVVGKGGKGGSGSIPLHIAYDGEDGGYSAVHAPDIIDTVCKATGGHGSPHAWAENGNFINTAIDNAPLGLGGGTGTIGDILLAGGNGTEGSAGQFTSGTGGNGGDGAGPLGGAGGLGTDVDPGLNYGVPGYPYGGGGSGTGDYEGNGGTYKVGGDGAHGGVIITVINEGIITQPISSNTLCTGETISVDYLALGQFNSGNIFEIQLSDANGSFDTPIIIGTLETTESGTITGIIPSDLPIGTGYRYRVTGNNPFINGNDNGTDITIKESPSVDAGVDQLICGGEEVTLTASNPDGATISWDNNITDGVPFTPSTGTTVYTVSATLNGCTATDEVQITAFEAPDFSVVANHPTQCDDPDGELILSGLNPNESYLVSYNNLPAVSMTADSNGTIIISGLNSGVYSQITVENEGQCSSTNMFTFNLSPFGGNYVFVNDLEICFGELDTLAAKGVPPGGEYVWNSYSTLTPINDSVAYVNPLQDEMYIITYTYNGCVTADTAYVTVHPLPQINAGGSVVPVCIGESVTLTANGGASYSWSNGENSESITVNPSEETMYYVEGTDIHGCSNIDSILVTPVTEPIAIVGDEIPAICKNEISLPMNGSIDGGATSGYWSGGTGTWNNASDPQAATYQAGMDDLGMIELRLTATNGGCPDDIAVKYIEVLDCILGIDDESIQSVRLFPNPANQILTVESQDLMQNYNELRLVSLTGQVVLKDVILNNSHSFNVEGITPGMYILHLYGQKAMSVKVEIR